MGRIGCAGQCSALVQLFHLLCDILRPHPILDPDDNQDSRQTAMTCPLFDEDDVSAANLVVIDVTEKKTADKSSEEDPAEYYGDDVGFEVGTTTTHDFFSDMSIGQKPLTKTRAEKSFS